MLTTIGSLRFTKKAEATEWFRRILHRHPAYEPIPEPDAAHLGWLFERHPKFVSKCGAGVSHFYVHITPFDTRGFALARVDGSTTDFSFLKCIHAKEPEPLAQVLQAMRREVGDDIARAKHTYFEIHGDVDGRVPCAITGELIGIEDAHADHAPPRTFTTLAIAFLKGRKISDMRSMLAPSEDNQFGPKLADRVFAAEWKAYHQELAVVRVVAKHINIARADDSKVKRADRQLVLWESS
jgi:hypothetical protein